MGGSGGGHGLGAVLHLLRMATAEARHGEGGFGRTSGTVPSM